MFAWRSPSEPTGRNLSGYRAAMQFAMNGPLFEAHDPGGIGLPGEGDGEGDGAGAAGVRKPCVVLQALEFSPSPARTRQKWVVAKLSGVLLKVVSPASAVCC
jgi:hypothetical protein